MMTAWRIHPRDRILQFGEASDALQRATRILGLSVTVVQDQQFVVAEGFGHGDTEGNRPAASDTPAISSG